jgi:hypothetical protein
MIKQQFGLQTHEQGDYFAQMAAVPISPGLRDYLQQYGPLALAIGTEKARSELLIMPILVEVHQQLNASFSLFSGVEFTVDSTRGLGGTCDYLLSLSPEQWAIEAPVVVVVEAKNENIRQGLNQCIAEMIAVQIFSQERHSPLETVYGVVTTGSNWKFLRLAHTVVYLDRAEYHINDVERIVGILVGMLCEAVSAAKRPTGVVPER